MDEVIAPDGSKVMPLLRAAGGSLARFELAEGRTSRAVAHRSVEELWYIVGGQGEMWRKGKTDDAETVTRLEPGIAIALPVGTHFQFRSFGPGPLTAVAVTMPPWPGEREAFPVKGKWQEDL